MIKRLAMISLAFFTPLSLGASADREFEEILDRYFEIHASLAADSIEGIDAAAHSIGKLAAEIRSDDSRIKALRSDLESAASRIEGKSLDDARVVFFELSKPLLVYLNQFYEGDKGYFRYYCSMLNKAWVQQEEPVKNPYHGSSMLTCGELIE
jgi:hypothetical protein